MNRQDYLCLLDGVFQDCLKIVEHKSADYASDNDPFRNFRQVEALGLCAPEVGIVVRLSDKLSRLTNLLSKDASVKDESLEDTIKDAINYLAILLLFLKSEKRSCCEKKS